MIPPHKLIFFSGAELSMEKLLTGFDEFHQVVVIRINVVLPNSNKPFFLWQPKFLFGYQISKFFQLYIYIILVVVLFVMYADILVELKCLLEYL
jgi:hypothetical protein